MQINNLNIFNTKKITITDDKSNEMLTIKTAEGEVLFDGNYWDFDRSGEFIKDLLTKMGVDVTLSTKTY
jgi:hypothetical protein